ncbi:helix-turn-helix domain-containing protein, partial [Parapedobacter sp. DT-150]|uniref:helix-turn-helix domain-containing protein n=1 Tax=Parapedobacter sp. DT-150 TaxID=3396162 RepID=UPI003F1C7BBE
RVLPRQQVPVPVIGVGRRARHLVGKVGTSGDIIGKYERCENIPSIDVTAKIADALGVTLDYLVKDGEYEHIDNETLKRLKEVQGLDGDTRAHVFTTIDAFIKAAKPNSIAAL